jgi:hypothetical protein
MVKICQTGFLKLNFEIIPKTFSGFCQNLSQVLEEVEIFLPIFESLGPSGVWDGSLYIKM